MKINRLFSIAAATMMMVACSSEDTALKNTPAAGPQMQFTATIAAPGSGATTRTEYTEVTTGEAAGTISVAWKVGDEIALVHNGVKDVATVKTVNANGSATIEGIITGSPKDEDPIQLFYPSALVKSVTNDGPVFDDDLWGRISTQDGTLKYIQDNLDFRRAKGQLSVNETSATLKEAATMNSMLAIWKLTLQNDAETPAALSAKQVSVQLTADVPILRARTAELTTPISSFYLAMEPFTEAPITIEATVEDDTYKYEKKSVTLEAGKYYQSTVTMAKKAANAYLKWDNTKKELVATPMPDTYTTVTSSTTTWAAGTYVVEGEVTISGRITLNGNVDLIIKDGAKLTVNDRINGTTSKYNLSIYGQANQTGQLVVNNSGDAICSITTLEVHSCQVKSTASADNCSGFYNISTFNVYGGSVDSENTGTKGNGIWLASNNSSMKIYGGEVKAVGKGNGNGSYGIMASSSSSVTVYGGKLWAECAGKKALQANITLTKDAGYTSGKIEYSSDKSTWSETVDASAKYVRVGY